MTDPYIDWSAFWSTDPTEQPWLYEPILAHGRGHAIYAAKKQGKSLVMLSLAAHLSQQPNIIVIYLDYEMTEADLFERLEDMGYGPDSDLSQLRYALLPSIPPLDSRDGGLELAKMVDIEQHKHPDAHIVVIIDTYGRAVVDPESSADTTRAFYRWTGLELKRRHVTWSRLDHSGKDKARGQRGSSAKGDDVDIIWELNLLPNEDITLKCTAARMSWVPDDVYLIRGIEPLTYRVRKEIIPPVVEALIMELDLLDLPTRATVRESRDALTSAKLSATAVNLQAAVRARKARRYTLDTRFPIHGQDENE
jgi:hypothetical protein